MASVASVAESSVFKPVFKPGDRVARYEVVGRIGSGSTGQVFLAEQPIIRRKVAIKVLARAGKRRTAGFHEEARKLALLDHPNIVDIYDVGEHDGLPYIAMQYLEGRSLDELGREGAGVSAPVLLRIAATVASALEHAHSRGVIHRDVKPSNIIVGPSGEPVLCDFSPSPLVTGDPDLDAKGIVGTPGYMSPEQARGDEATPRTDVWGLGATVFDLVAGRPPYDGAPARELVRLAASTRPVDLGPLRGRAPECVCAVVERCLRKDPAARYAAAEALRGALGGAIDYLEVSASGTAAIPPPSEGQTLLLHVEHREPELRGKFREFEIIDYVGGGAYGDVYRALERLTGRTVALKVLRSDWLSDDATVARFRREAKMLSRIAHPNIVRLYNYGRYGSTFFIAMDFIEGRPLDDVMDDRPRMAVAEAVGIASQVLAGLSAAHEAGVVHRDLKPANVMLVPASALHSDRGERAVLCDFGMATALDAGRVTSTGVILGSPSYMSPEQATGEETTSASDVYSAGVMLHEMLAGDLPHAEGTTRELLRAIVQAPPAPIGDRRPDVPEAVVRALARMLAKDPAKRPAAAEARQVLAAAASSGPLEDPPARPKPLRRGEGPTFRALR